MKVLQINTVYPIGSTGRIAARIHDQCVECGIECRTAYRYKERTEVFEDVFYVSSWLDCHVHNRLASITGFQGCFSFIKTLFFLRKVKSYNPDIIHLHNIHGSYIHHGLLFSYIKRHKKNVVWTLHDCWSFTGGCAHFSYENCLKWKTGCYQCEKINENFLSDLDNSKIMWKLKHRWFVGVKELIIITPSQWLSNLVKQSFLKDYENLIIRNGIDLSIFKPTDGDFRKRMGISTKKYIILGVASIWNKCKGLDVFIELSKRLDKEKYQIVLVGTDEHVDNILPECVISIHRTHNQRELAQIYTAADLFVNPTREEMLGLVNIEANACGTPVVMFRTGGSPECINELSGSVVECDDIDAMEHEIIRICSDSPYSREDCINRAKIFDMTDRYKEYINLYERINITRN